jgi:hypothetical protein
MPDSGPIGVHLWLSFPTCFAACRTLPPIVCAVRSAGFCTQRGFLLAHGARVRPGQGCPCRGFFCVQRDIMPCVCRNLMNVSFRGARDSDAWHANSGGCAPERPCDLPIAGANPRHRKDSQHGDQEREHGEHGVVPLPHAGNHPKDLFNQSGARGCIRQGSVLPVPSFLSPC